MNSRNVALGLTWFGLGLVEMLAPRTVARTTGPAARACAADPRCVKASVWAASRTGNKALHRVGSDSATLDFFGHSRVHPMAEAYFIEAPSRYGDYVAKLAVVPAASA